MAAISSYDKPCVYRNTITIRCSGGKLTTADRTRLLN